MQFFALILLNIAMFAIFYLIISLKLERKATEFRERKLRRLMEEMISDFNETAERNISLLEHRINTMKRLLQSSGDLRTLDVSVFDERDALSLDVPEREASRQDAPAGKNRGMSKAGGHATPTVSGVLSQSAGVLAGKLRRLVSKAVDGAMKSSHAAEVEMKEASMSIPETESARIPGAGTGRKQESIIEKDLSSLGGGRKKNSGDGGSANDEDISGLFTAASDKYALVGELYGKGYSIELISRCSGIPQGEIRLVLNLGM